MRGGGPPPSSEVIRDPLWDNIPLDDAALAALDTAAVQRLRYVRQLGHAFLVYPGATHSRFEHALGAYHLTRRALAALEERGELRQVPAADRQAVALAALLHDIGHYPFSHALEEAAFPSHEAWGVARLAQGDLADRLRAEGGDQLIEAIGLLIRGRSGSPLQGLISGTLDLDKIDYLSRDARNCGVPYGAVDVDRLIASLAVVETAPGRLEIGVSEKGVSALESLLFAKYQMYRNVYWHHAVRSATCMFKRSALNAVARGSLTTDGIAELTDDVLMGQLMDAGCPLASALRARRLHKRAVDLPAGEVLAHGGAGGQIEAAATSGETEPEGTWIADDPALLRRVEDALAAEVGLAPGELLLDFPARSGMLGVDLPLVLRDGRVERLTGEGRAGWLGLPRVANELYRTARRFRVFTARAPRGGLEGTVALLAMPAAELAARLERGGRLLPPAA